MKILILALFSKPHGITAQQLFTIEDSAKKKLAELEKFTRTLTSKRARLRLDGTLTLGDVTLSAVVDVTAATVPTALSCFCTMAQASSKVPFTVSHSFLP